ncbi:hypothetical protein NPIL_619691 [Nephila pilipes]|uniref:Uncharacterized protein n=1 Tax=Nephila pilipes TaxID=299642 RepID=A0A8X6TFE3_NEPPI|nr:hypothetical protein NPIL_619691 [Nephila pilipes]
MQLVAPVQFEAGDSFVKRVYQKYSRDVRQTFFYVTSDDEEDTVLDESDTDEEEHILEKDYSKSKLGSASNSEDEGIDDRSTYSKIVHLKKNRNIIEFIEISKNTFKKIKQTLRNTFIHVPEIISRAKNLTDILDLCK